MFASLTQSNVFLIALAVFLLTAASAPAQNAAWKITVTRIEQAGKAAESATMDVRRPNSTWQRLTIRTGNVFKSGTALKIPARITMTLTTSNGVEQTFDPGTEVRFNSGTETGEDVELFKGRGFFSLVRKHLDFFNVRYETFQALVRGTVFSVTVVPKQYIEFGINKGKIKLERKVQVFIQDVGGASKEASITQTEYLSAGQKNKRYRLDVTEYLQKFKTYKDAEEFFRKQLQEDGKSGDPDLQIDGLANMGEILFELGKYSEARDVYRDLLDRFTGTLSEEYRAWALSMLGNSYRSLTGAENLANAIECHKKSYAIRLRLYPDFLHPDIALSCIDLGGDLVVLGGKKNLLEAIEYYTTSLGLSLLLSQNGASKSISDSYAGLGCAYHDLGGTQNLAKAIDCHYKSLDVLRILYPDGSDPLIADCYQRLAAAYDDIGGKENFSKAIKCYDTSLAIYRKIYPDGHNAIAGYYQAIGVLYHNMGSLDQAIKCHDTSLAMHLKIYPDKLHEDIADCYNNLGVVYRDLGGMDNLTKAIEYYYTSLAVSLILYNDGQHPHIVQSYDNLVYAFQKLGGANNLEKSKNIQNEAQAIQLKTDPLILHSAIERSYIIISNSFFEQKQYSNAAATIEKGIMFFKKKQRLYPQSTIIIGKLYGNLSYYALFQRNFPAGREAAERGLALSPDQLWIKTNLAHSYLLSGDFETAKRIYLENCGKTLDDLSTFASGVLDDFKAFRECGIDHPDMVKIEALDCYRKGK